MDRRHLVTAAAGLAALASTRAALAQDGHAGHPAGHGAGRYRELAEASAHCVITG